MTRSFDRFGLAAIAFCIAAMILPLGMSGDAPMGWWDNSAALSALIATLLGGAALAFFGLPYVQATILLLVLTGFSGLLALGALAEGLQGGAGLGFWALIFGIWALCWKGIDALAKYKSPHSNRRALAGVAIPVMFGCWLLFLWEVICVGFGVPQVLLPAPSVIWVTFLNSGEILRADFYQTFVKSVIPGYLMGCGAGLVVAVLVDRSPFLKRGLMPVANMVSSLPIIGVAPIMVMWFGFDWQSKAAVVVIMTFFPMLVNTVTGLGAAGAIERELMRSYAAGYWQTLFMLRMPAAMPFIFNALKINSTLALIGAIVAEFFGTPIVGMGFRISTEVGRMNVDMVWAEILVAALAGSTFYFLMSYAERLVTFWHPSYRSKH